MYRFFTDHAGIGEEYIEITGSDVNHIRNVLRMKGGEEIVVTSDGGYEYVCVLDEIQKDTVRAKIIDMNKATTELPSRIYLFQGLPKGDKMELIIQKAVELGIHEIIPVTTKRTVVKLDQKKEVSKLKRWNAISESAAKQSGRAYIPEITSVHSWKEALECSEDLNVLLIPYEQETDMAKTKSVLENILPGQSIGIFIGPEGGFSESEVPEALKYDAQSITLGKRILRTETAGLMILSVLMFQLEE